MKRCFLFSALAVMAIAMGSLAFAQAPNNTAVQNVTIEVKDIYRLSIGGLPVTLTITDGTPGSTTFAEATHNTSHYSITSNKAGQKLTAKFTGALPTGLDLFLSVVAPAGRGTVAAETSIKDELSHDVLTAIPRGASSNQTINYRLTATTDAATLASTVYTVTWTLQD